jgi:hypothetical protein
MPPSLADIGADFHDDDDFALAATFVAPGVDALETTCRAVSSQAADTQQRTNRRDRLSCILYFLRSAIPARPERGSTATVSGDSAYTGIWTLTAAAEPTSHGEWRCLAIRETATSTIAAASGFPRPS